MSIAFQEVTRFPPSSVAIKIVMALAVGMLVGFERESANKDVGIRTFGLAALLGALSVLISSAYALVALIGIIVLVASLNARAIFENRAPEITTSAALLVTCALGVLVGLGHTFTPVAAAILMTLLLAGKMELHRFAGGVSIHELRGAVLLGLIGLVIYPVLPDRFVDPWGLVNLRQAWISVVVIACVAFVNYVLLRMYSTRGLNWTAILGGLVSNRAAVAELLAVVTGGKIAVLVLFATLAMFIRNFVLLALFAPQAVLTAIGPLFAMACVALLIRTGKADDEPGQELTLRSPISLRRVLGYGVLFLAIQVVGTLAARLFGNFGLMAASGITGMASSASTTVAVANLSASGKISPELAGTAAVIGSMTSALTNVPVVFRRLPGKIVFKIASSTALQILVGITVLAVQHYFRTR
ncbi:MAG TPA: DUF4010 domain-containing protein [Candidatus Acidoferrales bacterium]|nr:DUF4010 domain-containing protein [Candidatus Acidoferrales bacterium]